MSRLFLLKPVELVEGDGGVNQALFTVRLFRPSNQTITVDFATRDQTAVAGLDYVATSGTLSFSPGEIAQTIAVDVLGDTEVEIGERFRIDLSNPVNADLGDETLVGLIRNDDVGILIDDVKLAEGDAGNRAAVFTLRLTEPTAQAVSVDFATVAGTAVAGEDFVATSGTAVFAAGATETTVTVQVIGDGDYEIGEDFSLVLNDASNAQLLDDSGRAVILNDDLRDGEFLNVPRVIRVESVARPEGDGPIVFTLRLNQPAPDPVTVNFRTVDDSAIGGVDYIAASGTATFAVGEVETTISIDLVDDAGFEANERFVLELSDAVGASINNVEANGVIVNDDGRLLIEDSAVIEGDSGTTAMQFTVLLEGAGTTPVSVDFATRGSGAGTDYVSTSGTLNFAPGESRQIIEVDVIGDTDQEAVQAFFVDLSNPVGAELGDATGRGLIYSEEVNNTVSGRPGLFVGNPEVLEGDSGSRQLVFDVFLSAAPTETITVDFATADHTARAGQDYLAAAGTLSFAPGEQRQQVLVDVLGDTDFEATETLFLSLSNVGGDAFIGDGNGRGLIHDDDNRLRLESLRRDEGDAPNNLNYEVRLQRPADELTVIDFATRDGTATAGEDYLATDGSVIFRPGEISQIIDIPVLADTELENDETLHIDFAAPIGVNLVGNGSATLFLDNDDNRIAVSDVIVAEGDGPGQLVFTLRLDHADFDFVTVDYQLNDLTTTAGVDYVADAGGTVTFNPGEVEQTIVVEVLGDTDREGNERLELELSNAQGAELLNETAEGQLRNDDPSQGVFSPRTPEVSVLGARAIEGDAGNPQIEFTVFIDRAVRDTVSVDYITRDRSALAGEDYQATTGRLIFNPGEVVQTVVVDLIGDTEVEGTERFSLDLFNVVNATLGADEGRGTIVDDDHAISVGTARIEETDGNTTLSFALRLNAPADETIRVDFETVGGSADAGVDFVATSGTAIFQPGQRETTVDVTVLGELLAERNETLELRLSNPQGASLADDSARGVILNDDRALSINDTKVVEGDSGTQDMVFTVRLDAAADETVTVDFITRDGSAERGEDYIFNSGTLSFDPGEQEQQIVVEVLGDPDFETFQELLFVELSNATNADILDGVGQGQILNDAEGPAAGGGPSIALGDVLSASAASAASVDDTPVNPAVAEGLLVEAVPEVV